MKALLKFTLEHRYSNNRSMRKSLRECCSDQIYQRLRIQLSPECKAVFQ